MATVYTHINPFKKRAIDYFQQCIGRIGKRGKIGSVLDELLRKQEFFHEFLASYGPALKPMQRQYLEEQAAEVQTELAIAYGDLEVLQSILESLNPCQACNGVGELRHIIEQDHSEYSKCPGCGGDGVAKAKVA
ncbi:hypothetical protein LCGC14_1563180 [marine sediment metagenome]|uniref:Uncharacterized protein n=1 Tax=marine sediment metagenome TaxID=412755 RepID=A0A0F9J816_9ZZZZ